jgi:enoyl-CoA hydratase/carnithine racemase
VPAARRLAWGIDTIDGRTACKAGLADEVADAPLEAALALATRLAALPASQCAAVKSYFAEHRAGAQADDAARALFDSACETPEARICFGRYAG